MTEPCDLTAIEARRLIGRRKLSPVELLESCLTRIGEVNHAVNAVVALDETRARAAAKEAEAAVMRGDELGPLHGLPIGIKDLEETEGLRTTYGSPILVPPSMRFSGARATRGIHRSPAAVPRAAVRWRWQRGRCGSHTGLIMAGHCAGPRPIVRWWGCGLHLGA